MKNTVTSSNAQLTQAPYSIIRIKQLIHASKSKKNVSNALKSSNALKHKHTSANATNSSVDRASASKTNVAAVSSTKQASSTQIVSTKLVNVTLAFQHTFAGLAQSRLVLRYLQLTLGLRPELSSEAQVSEAQVTGGHRASHATRTLTHSTYIKHILHHKQPATLR